MIGIAPFYLYPNYDRPWLCPVHLLAKWWQLTRLLGVDIRDQGTYVFRKCMTGDHLSANPTDSMVCSFLSETPHGTFILIDTKSNETFLTCFQNNLCDVGVDPRMYGTHSFHRGGCQYLAMELRWPLRHICMWGGRAESFDNLGTIFKFFLLRVDTPTLERDDYMNPHCATAARCTTCRCTCFCA